MLNDLQITPQMIPAIHEKADKGDAKAQYILGWLYFTGEGVDSDHEKASRMMTKAAKPKCALGSDAARVDVSRLEGYRRKLRSRKRRLLKVPRRTRGRLAAPGVIYSQGLGVDLNGDQAIKY